MSRSPLELGKERCAIALRKALAATGRYATIREVATATGVNYSTLRGYFQGRQLPSDETWRLLRMALGTASSARRPSADQAASPARAERRGRPAGGQQAQPSAASTRKSTNEPFARALEIRQQIQHLSNLLDFFKRGAASDREALRRAIPGRDMGYLTSLLRALYDEDQFEAWILFSEYTMNEDEQ
ncbi:MAG: helix-turn-helix transcriptional regulator [Candidatus Eisenbacteria sp.]|nr:helix-turn-helix transcriptional regulator [Candidatus Eisenbacteria bacterium]